MLKEYNHLILQEIHSNGKVEDKWKKDFHGQVFLSYGKANSEYNSEKSKVRIQNTSSILTVYFGTEKFTVKEQQTDHKDHILILDVSINDYKYILINLYNVNTGKEQIEVPSSLFALLATFDINPNALLWLEILIYFWTFHVSRTASYEITFVHLSLSVCPVCPLVTKFSQDWIINSF